MSKLPKSVVSLCWASFMFGMQQCVDLLSAEGATKAKAAAYTARNAIQEQFSADPVFFALDQIGDEAQRETVDLLCDSFRLKPLDPSWLGRTWGRFVRGAVESASALTPGGNLEATWQGLRNTLAVIRFVNQASTTLNLPPGEVRLLGAVDRAYALGGDYAALWLVEGLGEEYAERNWALAAQVRGLLKSGPAAQLPEKCLLMLHAGMGISFARRILRPLTPYTCDSEVAGALRRFVSLVHDNARPGYDGPALESLGLVTRSWYPQMTSLIDRHLWTISREALEYFWHGIGRGTYFNPRYLIPGASAFKAIGNEAPHQLARLNGTAGAAWAFTLVNIRQPEVLVHLLKKEGTTLGADDAFACGVASTVMMSLDTLPDNGYVLGFCRFQPTSADADLVARWDRMVHTPCQHATEHYFPLLRNRGRLGEIFRYQNLERLAASLEGQH